MFIWSTCRLLQIIIPDKNESLVISLEHISYIGVIFIPISLLFTGIIYARTKISISAKHLLLLIVPTISLVMVFTNVYHNLFIIEYSYISTGFVYGKYYIVHEIYSYACILIGLYYLLYFSIRNSGFFSKQSILIFIGVLLPLVVVLLSTQGIVEMPVFLENISFSFAVLCFAVAIFKYKFLNVIPIALKNVVDNISDAFVVIDESANIIEYNRMFNHLCNNKLDANRHENLYDLAQSIDGLNIDIAELAEVVVASRKEKRQTFEKYIIFEGFESFFTVEITQINSQDHYLGTLILLKDITEHKKNIEAIKEQQAILLEQERLASLGQLIGGIAHNLKTPIMSISGAIEALKDLTYEYRDSIDDRSVTEQDHKEIAKDMLGWLEKMRPYCAYMSDVISAVKGQAVQMSASGTDKFTVDEVVKRVDLLLKHELKRHHCVLKIDLCIDKSTEIKGEVNNLVQVFDNIIINAMHSYEGKNGVIELLIVRSGDNVEFTFKDFGKGIPKKVADRLFKEMVTTKGKKGTGLGLYMSYATIKGRFSGNISFTTKEDCGTTFFISIPCITYSTQEAE
jgi:signal transduction histidine kinase